MKVFISTSGEKRHEAAVEPTTLLFQILVHLMRVMVHDNAKMKREWLHKIETSFLPILLAYGRKVAQTEGPAIGRHKMKRILEESSKVLDISIKHAMGTQHKKKYSLEQALALRKTVEANLKTYEKELIEWLLGTTEKPASEIVQDLVNLLE